MDVVELHLPTSVVVSKLLESEVYGRIGGSEVRDSAAGSSVTDGRFDGARKVSSGCGSFNRDIYPVTTSTNSVSKNKKNDGAHGSLPSSLKYDQLTLGIADNSLWSSPKHFNKQSNRKSVKVPNSSSGKRVRTDQTESSTSSYLTKCTSVENSRVAKQKRGQESKRGDKKNFRTTARTKFDSILSKNGLVISDAAANGNNVFGPKSDLHDVRRSVDEVSLGELLDGSYKYPNICPDKGKKTANPNGNILLSIRKAYSILPLHSAVGSSGNRKAPKGILSSTSRDEEDNSVEELVLLSQVQDSAQATLSDSLLCQPKDVLEQLAVPKARDLDSLLLDFNMPLVPLHKTTGHASASLPPLPWSFSHGGSCKSSTDSGKSATHKSTCQGRWVRIRSCWSFGGDEHCCFSELNLKINDSIGDFSRQSFDKDLSQDEKMPAMDGKLPCDGHVGMSHTLAIAVDSDAPDASISKNPNVGSPIVHQSLGFNESAAHRNVEAEGSLLHRGDEPNSLNPSTSNLETQRIVVADAVQTRGYVCSCIDSNCYYSCKTSVDGCEQCVQYLSTSGVSSSGYSPRVLAAAEILCDMATHSDVTWKGNSISRKFRWPNTPSQMAMKAQKARPPIVKVDGLSSAPSNSDPAKSTSHAQSPQPKLMMGVCRSKKISVNSVGREPVRWFDPVQDTFPAKSEESHLAVSTKSLYGSSVRLVGQTPSPTRAERGTDGHHKHRRGIVTTSSVRTEGIYVKDWGRLRTKR